LLLCKTTINITVLPKNDRPFRWDFTQTFSNWKVLWLVWNKFKIVEKRGYHGSLEPISISP
jgi:hypothetical protein